MSLDQTRDGLSRREALSLGLAAVLSSLRPKSVEARGGDKRPERIYFYLLRRPSRSKQANGVFSIDPENDSWEFLTGAGLTARLSPDGSTLAYLDIPEQDNKPWVVRLFNLDTKETKPVPEIDGRPFWTSDGKELIVCGSKRDGSDPPTETWKIDVADLSKKVRLPIAETDAILDVSPDGKTLLIRRKPKEDERSLLFSQQPAHLIDLDGKDLGRVIAPGNICMWHRFTRDGKRIVYSRANREKEQSELWIVGIDGKDNRLFLGERETDFPNGRVVWSPDGKRRAVSYFERPKGPDGKSNPLYPNCHFEIADSNGANSRRLALPEDFGSINPIDWR